MAPRSGTIEAASMPVATNARVIRPNGVVDPPVAWRLQR
jgi:hypothetical protein